MTPAKGWGLYAKEVIPNEKFVIEYMGEIIDRDEFDTRFNRTKTNMEDNYYFLSLENGLYIDAAVHANRGRFINHSCEPNVTTNKWTVFSNGLGHVRIGFFTNREIKAVR